MEAGHWLVILTSKYVKVRILIIVIIYFVCFNGILYFLEARDIQNLI